MSTNPTVHILMPAYNVERYIRFALLSIMNQDYPRITTDTIIDTHFVDELMKQMVAKKADICLYNFTVKYENNSEMLQRNSEELINDRLNVEKILSYITDLNDQLVSVDSYPHVATFTSLGWTKAYSPFIKNNWPSSNKKYLYEDFAYMAALFFTCRITALPPGYQPISYLRRNSSLTGQRKPAHFYVDVIYQLLTFKENLGTLSIKKEKAANDFINRKIQQYERTLNTLISNNTPGFSKLDLELFQKAKRLIQREQ